MNSAAHGDASILKLAGKLAPQYFTQLAEGPPSGARLRQSVSAYLQLILHISYAAYTEILRYDFVKNFSLGCHPSGCPFCLRGRKQGMLIPPSFSLYFQQWMRTDGFRLRIAAAGLDCAASTREPECGRNGYLRFSPTGSAEGLTSAEWTGVWPMQDFTNRLKKINSYETARNEVLALGWDEE